MKLVPLLITVLILAFFIFTRLVYLDSGIHISEPDELSYDVTSKSLNLGFIPKYGGKPFPEQTPVFDYVAYFASLFVNETDYPRTFVSTRLVSVVSSFLLAVTIFLYLLKKEGFKVGLFSLVLFTLTPISLYYSKMGLREMLLLLFSFWFFITYERLKTNQKLIKSSLISGLLLGFSIAVKTTALIYLLIPAFYLVLSFIKELKLSAKPINSFHISLHLTKNWKQQFLPNTLVIITALLVAGLAFLPYIVLYPSLLKDRFFLTFLSHGSDGIIQKLQTMFYYLSHLDLWLSIPVVALLIIGLTHVFYKKDFRWSLLLVTMSAILFALSSNEPRGRYFVLLLPYLICLAALGLNSVISFSNTIFARFFKPGISITIATILFSLVTILGMLPSTQIALESGQHSTVEEAIKFVRQNYGGELVFSTFWPSIVQYSSGLPTLRLTDSELDALRDHNELPNFSPDIEEIPTDYIKNNPSIILIHRPLDKHEFSERLRAVSFVEQNYQPLKVISDNKPNFPEKTEPYSISIYKLDNKTNTTDNQSK